MSQMRELYEKVAASEELKAQFSAILQAAKEAGEEEIAKKLVQFSKNQGLDITIAEFQEFFKNLVEENHGELSEAEMDMVAGGKVSAGSVLASVFTLGVACAFASAVNAATRQGCGAFFQDNTLGGGGKG